MIATEERTQKAVDYLASTDKEHALIKAEYKAKDALTKTILAYEFIDAEGSIELRKAKSYTSESYIAHIESLKVLEVELQTMYNRRDTANVLTDLYRTESANLRKGNI